MINPACPQCEMNDQVEKVSTLYLEGLSANRPPNSKPGETPLTGLPKTRSAQLRRLLAPPSSGKAGMTRLIHPDLFLIAFSAILPVFLAGIARSQPGMLVPVILGITAVYALYFWRRKFLIARFESRKQAELDEKRRVERAIGRWMRAYYCARDEIVFEAGQPGWEGVENLGALLRR